MGLFFSWWCKERRCQESCEQLRRCGRTLAELGPQMKRDLLFWMDEPKARVCSTKDVVVVKDKYPKSHKHYLVVTKKDIPSIRDVRYEHLPVLKELDRVGRLVASKIGHGTEFWFGYHAWQTQQRLHLHVLSYDLCGTGMNTAWLWNSFTTPFFLKSEDVIDFLEKRKFFILPKIRDCLAWLNGPIVCHFCTCIPGDVYIMKDHIKEHFNGTDFFHIIRKKKADTKVASDIESVTKPKHETEPKSETDELVKKPEDEKELNLEDMRRQMEFGISPEIKPGIRLRELNKLKRVPKPAVEYNIKQEEKPKIKRVVKRDFRKRIQRLSLNEMLKFKK